MEQAQEAYYDGPKARIAVAAGMGAGLDRDGLAALLADPPGWGPVIEAAPRPPAPAVVGAGA
jgi:hypothetical protein